MPSEAARQTLGHIERIIEATRQALAPAYREQGDALQSEAHAFALAATQAEAARQLLEWSGRVGGPLERAIAEAYVARLGAAMRNGITLSPTETVTLAELRAPVHAVQALGIGDVSNFIAEHGGTRAEAGIAALIDSEGHAGRYGLDEALGAVQSQFARFTNERVIPLAQSIHRENGLVPMDLIEELGALGVFGLTLPEAFGGSGAGKQAMVIVTEELSRGYIGVGSLGTRSEIAGELIMANGTDEQKQRWLHVLADASALPTAAFTEPNFGSDLASVQTRAQKVDGGWRIFGQKTWMTHASRADMMTLLARTDTATPGHRGLSMFLAPKIRGTDGALFPDEGITGGEIRVLGYRGMREYDVAFDGFFVPGDALLGGKTGSGFRQLMATMESARIQTAARGCGLAQAALDEGLRYAKSRIQFGQPIWNFPRIRNKLAGAAMAVQAARQLTYHAARRKQAGERCDLEAGMAKMMATRAAFDVADAALQVHGGMGYAEETPISRIFVDARVMSIFEGTNEIQANIIARRLLE